MLALGEPSGASQWQEKGPNLGAQAAVESWLLVCTHVVAVQSPYWHAHDNGGWQWDVGHGAYRVTAVGLAPRVRMEWGSAMGLWASVLYFHSHKGLGWLPVQVPGSERAGGWGVWKGLERPQEAGLCQDEHLWGTVKPW